MLAGTGVVLQSDDSTGVPAALINGRPATVDAAIEAAAAILDAADLPLVFGLGNSTCESQRAAVRLTERIGGVIDTHTSLTHGPTKIGGQLVGKITCTLGEVMNRADLVVYWGTNPVETHPRHLKKFSFTPKGRFVPGGRHDRSLLVVDVRETLSARAADDFLQIRPGADFEVLTALRALVKGQALDTGRVEAGGVAVARLAAVAERMKRARFGVFFFGSGLTMTRGKHMNVAAITALTADLNAFTKFAAMPMRDHGNEAGSDNVMVWLTGYPFGVDFTRGYPRYNPGEFTAVDLLVRKEADAAVDRGRRSVGDDATGRRRSSGAHPPHRDRPEDRSRQPGGPRPFHHGGSRCQHAGNGLSDGQSAPPASVRLAISPSHRRGSSSWYPRRHHAGRDRRRVDGQPGSALGVGAQKRKAGHIVEQTQRTPRFLPGVLRSASAASPWL